MKREFTSLYQFFEVFPDEQSAIDHLRAIRWHDGAFCPYCNSKRVMHFSDNRTHKCHDCRQRFSIKVGTIFEDTKLPLRKWFAAVWLITSHKKGIASTQLAKDLQITQKTAWFVLHRLRYAARTRSFNRPLSGERSKSTKATLAAKKKTVTLRIARKGRSKRRSFSACSSVAANFGPRRSRTSRVSPCEAECSTTSRMAQT